ncbi:MAG: MoaD/ThiS family protein [Deltaproteobacteria bacterium]|nr:MoaD/ThiS family protein [Deltaproteobacteria bacterium]
MSVTMVLPGSLKKWMGNNSEAECEGATVLECVEFLENKFNGFKKNIVDENGNLRDEVLVFKNGTNIMNLEGPATSIVDGDDISVIPFAAGG